MTFLLKEMYFRNEDELTRFVSQYEIKFTGDKSVIDCKASQAAISQQKLLQQQLANWNQSSRSFVPFTHLPMHIHTFAPFIPYRPATHLILGCRVFHHQQQLPSYISSKQFLRAKFLVSSCFFDEQLLCCWSASFISLMWSQSASSSFDAWFGLPISTGFVPNTLLQDLCSLWTKLAAECFRLRNVLSNNFHTLLCPG